MSGYIYLASPYSARDERTRTARYRRAVKATAALMARGEVVFCPVAYGHAFEEESKSSFPYEYWLRWSRAMLAGAAKLYVLTLEGWESSVGIREEVTLAHSLGIPIVGYPADETCDDVSGFFILGAFGLAPPRPPVSINVSPDKGDD